jgi:RNA polymerase sigma-70 factor, ECF subfamily
MGIVPYGLFRGKEFHMGKVHITPEEMYQTSYPRIYQRVYRLLRHHEQAEDVTQESFLKAIRAWPTLTTTDNLSNWLYTIATNTAYDALRRQRRLSWSSLEASVLPVADHTSDPDEHYPMQAAVHHALSRLPQRSQRALLMHVVEGYSLQEIAAMLGLTPASTKNYLNRARRAFRECYAQEEVSA